MKNCSVPLPLEPFAAALIDGLKAELYLTPKPGLVDLRNNGAHPDLSLLTMSRSIRLLRGYLRTLDLALTQGAPLAELVHIGQQAEARMLRELGTNCHRGGIFLTGLLLSAARRTDPSDPAALREAVAVTAREFFHAHSPRDTHGQEARARYRAGGIVAEACAGLPALFEIGLPLLRSHGEEPNGIFRAMAALMQSVEDTTSLHRCGTEGLAQLRNSGRQLERALAAGEDPVPLLIELDREFIARNLTMGGVADILGISLGYYGFLRQGEGELTSADEVAGGLCETLLV